MSIPVVNSSPEPVVSSGQPFTMYVSDIPATFSEKKIISLFETMGGFDSFKGVVDPITGNCGSFGVVSYLKSSACARAYKFLNGLELDGKVLKLKMDAFTQERLAADRNEPLNHSTKSSVDESSTCIEGASKNAREENSEQRTQEDEVARVALNEFLHANNFKQPLHEGALKEGPKFDSVSSEYKDKPKKRKRPTEDGRLANELKIFRRKQNFEERRKWTERCVQEYFGKVDEEFVSYLVKLNACDLQQESQHYKDLKLVFLKDIGTFLSRLSSGPTPIK